MDPQELEARVHALLRDQPLRRAPHHLEQRVLAEIARREALPWWRKSYAHWPLAFQLLFLLVSLAAASLAVALALQAFGAGSVVSSVRGWFEPAIDAVQGLRAANAAVAELVQGWVANISPFWLYVGLGAIGTAYALLFGLGATAYRLLQVPR